MSSAQYKAAFCDGVWLLSTEGCMAWSQKQLFPLQKQRLCLTKGRGFKIHIFGKASCDSWKGSGNQFLKLNWTFTFFPSPPSECVTLSLEMWMREEAPFKASLQDWSTLISPVSPWNFEVTKTSFLHHLESDMLYLPFSLLERKGESVSCKCSPSPRWTNKEGLCYML